MAPPYKNGSFGNLGFRIHDSQDYFIITASNSSLKDANSKDKFVIVSEVDKEKGFVYSIGKMNPSSEAFLYDAIFRARKNIGAIFHGHCREITDNVEKLGIVQTKKNNPTELLNWQMRF